MTLDSESQPTRDRRPGNLRLAIVVFFSGAVVMSMELTGSRLIAPFLGSSLYIWTSLIGVILGFLSIGYYLGGRLSKSNPEALAPILLSASAVLLLVSLLELPILDLLANTGIDLRLCAVLAATILFSVPSILLGTITPLATRLVIDSLEESGEKIGIFYAISTLGSILGTFLTGFVLFAWISSPHLLQLLAFVLLLLSLLIAPRRMALVAIALLLAFVAIIHFQQRLVDASIEVGYRFLDTRYHRILIRSWQNKDGENLRALITDPLGAQSSMRLEYPNRLDSAYAHFYDLAVHQRGLQGDYLMLGGGAYSYPKHFGVSFSEANLQTVEIDPDLLGVATDYFGLKNRDNLAFTTADARLFVHNAAQKYNAIFIDVYKSAPEIPFHLATVEFFRDCKKHLHKDGLLVLNAIASIEGEASVLSHSLYKTLKTEFAEVKLFRVTQRLADDVVQNLIIIAGERLDFSSSFLPKKIANLLKYEVTDFSPEDGIILRDSFAPVEHLMTPIYRQQQQRR